MSTGPATNQTPGRKPLLLGEASIGFEELLAVACEARPVALAESAREAMRRSREVVEQALAGHQVIYGINTGFGALSQVRIEDRDLNRLQVNLLRSHAVGIGAPLSVPETRAVLLLRAAALAQGCSGVTVELVERLLALLNHGLHPVIPEKGSAGASGDLAPLAHAALPLIGEGEVVVNGQRQQAAVALAEAGLTPYELAPKEGLALINGTQVMLAVGALAYAQAVELARVADIAGAMSLDAQLGTDRAFDPRIHRVRPHPGQLASADNLRRLIAGSEIRHSHDQCEKVQDAYSLRCMPQVHGAVQGALMHVGQVLLVEMDSVTDNPLVFDGPAATAVLSGGNFHGEPVALACDYLTLAMAELGALSERRIERMVNPQLSNLSPFLAARPGLESGMMIAQVAAAALACENAALTTPASAHSLPTSANQEDHISMGTFAARKLREVVGNVEAILAIELLCAVSGIEQRRPLASSPPLEAVVALVREAVPASDGDRVLAPEVEQVRALIRTGRVGRIAAAAAGTLAPQWPQPARAHE